MFSFKCYSLRFYWLDVMFLTVVRIHFHAAPVKIYAAPVDPAPPLNCTKV
jgi:hypothetical protein